MRLHDGVQLRANVSPVSSLCSGCRKQQQQQKGEKKKKTHTPHGQFPRKINEQTDVQLLHVSTPVSESCGYR